MRGIERLVAGALLVLALTATAVLARTSAPGGGHAQAVRLQSPPRSHLVAPLPVVIAVPEAPLRRVLAHRPTPPAPSIPATVAPSRPVEVPSVSPTPPPRPVAPAAAPPAPPAPDPPTRVVASVQTQPAATKAFGHSHPRGHAWGHVKHAGLTTPPADASAAGTDDESQAEAPPAETPPAAEDQPLPDPGNGNAWGHSKHGSGD
jgi:hypothetical protein